MESHKYARDILWFSIAQLFVALILGIIALPAFTKSYPAEIYGTWMLVTVTVELVSPLLSLQLGLSIVKYLAGVEDRLIRRRALGATLTAILIFSVLLITATLLFTEPISVLLFDSPNYVNLVILIAFWTLVNSFFNFFISYLRVRGKIKGISIIQVAMTVLKMLLIVGLAGSGYSLEIIVISMIILQTVFALIILVAIIREIGIPVLNFSGLRTYLLFSLPQMPGIVLLWFMSLGDRTFITHFMGLSDTGIYSSSNTIAGITSVFYAPIAFVLFPMISQLWRQNRLDAVRTYFESSLRLFVTLAIPGAVGITMISQPLLKLLTTEEFLVGENLVILIAMGAVFLGIYQISMNLVLLGKYSRWLPFMTGLAAATSIIMNLILIPRFGILGAAIANCSAYLVLAVVTTIWARKTLFYSLNYKYLAKVAGSSCLMALAIYFLKFNSILSIILSLVIGGAVFAAGLYLLRAFSREDKELIRKILFGMVPGYLKKP